MNVLLVTLYSPYSDRLRFFRQIR